MVWPTLGSRTAEEQNSMLQIQSFKPDWLWTDQHHAAYFRLSASHTNSIASSADQHSPPPNLCRKSAVDQMLCKIHNHRDWPVDLCSCWSLQSPISAISSWHPVWLDLSPVDMNSQWKEDWQSASVTNCAIVEDSTSRQPGFDLPRYSWSLLKCFRVGQGTCKTSLYKWGLTKSPICSSGDPQNMDNIVNSVDQVWRRSDDSTRIWRRCCQLWNSVATTAVAKW